METSGKTEIVYSVRATERELNLFERIVELGTRAIEVAEDLIDATKTQAGLEGGKSLFSTFNRAFDQIAFHHEASTRHVETSTRLNETYIELVRKQVENQEKLIKSIEEVRKAQAGQSSAIQSLDKRLKNFEGGTPQQPRMPFRDGRNKPHQNRNQKVEATPPAAPTSHEEQPAKKEGTVVTTRTAPREPNAVSTSNAELQEQVQMLSVVKAG